MQKNKLISLRKKKGITQKEVAERLYIDVSNYNRREKGIIHIRPDQWIKLAEILNVPIDEIYETDDKLKIINENQSNIESLNKEIYNNYVCPQKFIEIQKKYIKLLEEKIEILINDLNFKKNN